MSLDKTRNMISASDSVTSIVEDYLFIDSSIYAIVKIIGTGDFGKVAECTSLVTKETVAMKMMKDRDAFRRERDVLKILNKIDPQGELFIKLHDHFKDRTFYCLALEMLDIDLHEYMSKQTDPMKLEEICDIAEQLLNILHFLQQFGIVHCDIKPDNVMFINKSSNLEVKLIDFGLATPADEMMHGKIFQCIGYRAPEVFLGLPLSFAVDVFSLGCVLAFLYVRGNFFPEDPYEIMSFLVKDMGQPSDDVLQTGMFTDHFFKEEETEDGSKWRLMTREEFCEFHQLPATESDETYKLPNSLDDLIHIQPLQAFAEQLDRMAFIDLLRQLWQIDPTQRISPAEALQHPFFSRSTSDCDSDGMQSPKLSQDNTILMENPAERVSTSEVSAPHALSLHMSNVNSVEKDTSQLSTTVCEDSHVSSVKHPDDGTSLSEDSSESETVCEDSLSDVSDVESSEEDKSLLVDSSESETVCEDSLSHVSSVESSEEDKSLSVDSSEDETACEDSHVSSVKHQEDFTSLLEDSSETETVYEDSLSDVSDVESSEEDKSLSEDSSESETVYEDSLSHVSSVKSSEEDQSLSVDSSAHETICEDSHLSRSGGDSHLSFVYLSGDKRTIYHDCQAAMSTTSNEDQLSSLSTSKHKRFAVGLKNIRRKLRRVFRGTSKASVSCSLPPVEDS